MIELDTLLRVAIQVNPVLDGIKRAVQSGNTLHVSPAMFDLLMHADEEELQQLCETIEVLHIRDLQGGGPFLMGKTDG